MTNDRRNLTPSSTLELASPTSIAMLMPLIVALNAEEKANLTPVGSLPSPVCHLAEANVILSATPIIRPPLYRDRMTAAATALDADVVMIRHGFHPEVLDEVVYDVVMRERRRPVTLWDRHLFRATDGGLWLVPSRPARGGGDRFVQFCPRGLFLTCTAPYADADDRCEGVSRAARETVLAQRRPRRR